MRHLILILIINLIFSLAYGQNRRLPELRSCMASEMALGLFNADESKTYEQNVISGKKIGYVIAEFYQTAIWSLDNPEIEGREVIYYALTHAEQRQKLVSIEQLQREVKRCRLSFSGEK